MDDDIFECLPDDMKPIVETVEISDSAFLRIDRFLYHDEDVVHLNIYTEGKQSAMALKEFLMVLIESEETEVGQDQLYNEDDTLSEVWKTSVMVIKSTKGLNALVGEEE